MEELKEYFNETRRGHLAEKIANNKNLETAIEVKLLNSNMPASFFGILLKSNDEQGIIKTLNNLSSKRSSGKSPTISYRTMKNLYRALSDHKELKEITLRGSSKFEFEAIANDLKGKGFKKSTSLNETLDDEYVR